MQKTLTMLLSHKHKFIFIKTNKTAGTSIEIGLSRFCGNEGIITPNDPADEEIRNAMGYPRPRNCYAKFLDYRFKDIYKLLVRRKPKLKFYHHMPAAEIRTRVGEECWKSYYKFCFERNPFDRVISFYYWRTKKGPKRSISEFIDSGEVLMLKKYGYHLYTIDEKIVVDRVCRYEDMLGGTEPHRHPAGFWTGSGPAQGKDRFSQRPAALPRHPEPAGAKKN